MLAHFHIINSRMPDAIDAMITRIEEQSEENRYAQFKYALEHGGGYEGWERAAVFSDATRLYPMHPGLSEPDRN